MPPPVRAVLVRASRALPPAARGKLKAAVHAVDTARAQRVDEASGIAFLESAAAHLRPIATTGRSARLLVDQIAEVRSNPQLLRDLRHHPWTHARYELLDLACAAALDLVVDGRLEQADWLAQQILAADPHIKRAHEVRAFVAVEYHRPVRAREHFARCAGKDAGSPPVRLWLRRQHERMAARAVFTELAGGVDAPAGGAVQVLQAALQCDDSDRRDRLQALAVAEASRPGAEHDAGLWRRRYLFERLANPQQVEQIRRDLDARYLTLRAITGGDGSSSHAVPARPRAELPHGSDDTAVAFYVVGPQTERDLPVALAETMAAEVSGDLVVVHGGLDPVTVAACVEVAPGVRFVAADVRRWAALRVGPPSAARRLPALDALALTGYRRLVLAPATSGVGAHVRVALRADRDGVLPATSLRDDVVRANNLVVVDAAMTGDSIAALDVVATEQFGVSGYDDPAGAVPWRVLTVLRERLVADGSLDERYGFSSSRVPVARFDELGDDAVVVRRADASMAQVDNVGASELLADAVELPYQLTDRVLLKWSQALHRSSRYAESLALLEVVDDRDGADVAGASTTWVTHDRARGAAYVRALATRTPEHPRVGELSARVRTPEPALPDTGSALVHVAAYIGRGGNYGDRVLPIAVRKAVSSVSATPLEFVSVQAHQLFDDERRELAEGSSGVIVGGGGLFLPDTAPNGNSAWQWNVPTEQLRRLDVPLAVVAVGFNLFRGQSYTGNLFAENLAALVDRADVVGLRNHGSIRQVRSLLPSQLADKIEYLPCPTTVLAHLDPTLAGPVERGRSVLINAAYDRSSLRFGDSYGTFLAQLAGYITALQADDVAVRIVSHMAPDEQLAADLRRDHDLDLPLLKLNLVPLDEAYRLYQEAGVVVGMRGHATMIPFGLRTPVLSLVSHPKMRYFLDDIAHPEWGFEISEPFEGELLERTRHVLASPGAYVENIVAAQQILLDAVQTPLRRFVGAL